MERNYLAHGQFLIISIDFTVNNINQLLLMSRSLSDWAQFKRRRGK